MYSVTNIEGKNLGCVATNKIKKGTLILREKPCLLVTPDLPNTPYKERIAIVIESYGKMSNEEKEQYLNLSNSHSQKQYQEGVPEEDIRYERSSFETSVISTMNLMNISPETAETVHQIYKTNAFHNGVCLQMSRFNHSCCSNAEYFWNDDTETRDLRAIKNISQNEEITLNYVGVEMQTIHERRKSLQENFNFWCSCIACDVSEEEAENQKEKCLKFKTLKEVVKTTKDPKQEIDCIKQMYKIVKELKILRIGGIINGMLEYGFDASCQGFYNLRMISSPMPDREQFLKDAENFATVGLQLSIMLYGIEQTTSLEWQQKKTNPIEVFEREHVDPKIHQWRYAKVPT